MKFHYIASAVASTLMVGALAMPTVSYAAGEMDKAKTEMKDSWITTKIKSEYVKDKTVSATHIRVMTEDHGVVTLGGHAKSQFEIDRAIHIARGVKGVTDVQNNIEIASN